MRVLTPLVQRSFCVALAWPLEQVAGTRHLRSASLQQGEHQLKTEWYDCAKEGDEVPVSGITRFGSGMNWVETHVSAGGTCCLAAFDGQDPMPGIRKVCQCTDAAGAAEESSNEREEMGVRWRKCAEEGQNCECPSRNVRFGKGTRWLQHSIQHSILPTDKAAPSGGILPSDKSITCDTMHFKVAGVDPAPGITKECWCDERVEKPPGARVGVVMLTRRPPDLKTWLQYHLDYAGVDHVFFSVEDSPEFNRTFSAMSPQHRSKVTIWHQGVAEKGDKRPKDDYDSLQARQQEVMGRAREESARMGIDWLLHTDDDELLYTPMHRSIGDVLANMPQGYDQAFLPNVEAIYPSASVQSCFTETKMMNMNMYSFVSYANGKAAVRVASGALPNGPHQWRAAFGGDLNGLHLDREPFGAPLMVVHFESCPFQRWETKYWELGNTSPEKVASIPFPFYRDSITRMQTCTKGEREEDGKIHEEFASECSEASLKQFWGSWKTQANPRIRKSDLMPIDIPWSRIVAADF